ncbi:MAG: glycosyl hydrolase 53 family protein [Ferruginibacter sp.]|nr:glycosyl hydrolase 53 family protein [Ferruginibacter sp.]
MKHTKQLSIFKILATCLIIFSGLCMACKKNGASAGTPHMPVPPLRTDFVKGADVSWITQMEAEGRKFYNSAGVEQDPIAILKGLGMNTVRLRVWVDPANGWNNTADVVKKAVRAKNLGMRIMIVFHYSDTWADPGKQGKPPAWATQDFATMKISLSNHTKEVLNALKASAVTPEWVSVGNETNNGMLWPQGQASDNMNNFAQLIIAGHDASKEVFPQAKVIVHISNGYDNALFRWIFDGLKSNGAKWDVIGMSLYPTPSNWNTLTNQCLANMNDMVTRFNSEVMICEVGMSWDQPVASKAFITDIITKVRSLPNDKGLGVLYWEPQSYNSWQGYTLGAFDNSGKPTGALDAFK